MAKVFENPKNLQSVPAMETVSDDNEGKKFDAEAMVAMPHSCVNPAEAKPEKSGGVNIFSKLGFRPKGKNRGEQGGKQEIDKSQKKTSGSAKTQDSKSQSDKKGRDTKDPKSGGQKLK